MKFRGLDKRIRAIEPQAADSFDLEEIENERLLMQLFEPHFLEQLQKLGCSDLIDEFRAALQTIGPQPFGSDRPDDRSIGTVIEGVSNRHHDLAYRLRAVETSAWADVYCDLGEPEDSDEVQRLREYAARDLEWEKKDLQTFCDLCGNDLTDWNCYTFKDGEMVKICRQCSNTGI